MSCGLLPRLVVGVFIFKAAAGCAVLTIDVDVYKGALANQEHVQFEQLAAMAMGVKPLLAELRYTLEGRACQDRLRKIRSSVSSEPDVKKYCSTWLEASQDANFVDDTHMLSRDARRVN